MRNRWTRPAAGTQSPGRSSGENEPCTEHSRRSKRGHNPGLGARSRTACPGCAGVEPRLLQLYWDSPGWRAGSGHSLGRDMERHLYRRPPSSSDIFQTPQMQTGTSPAGKMLSLAHPLPAAHSSPFQPSARMRQSNLTQTRAPQTTTPPLLKHGQSQSFTSLGHVYQWLYSQDSTSVQYDDPNVVVRGRAK